MKYFHLLSFITIYHYPIVCVHPLECRQLDTKAPAQPFALFWLHRHAHFAPLCAVMCAALSQASNCCWGWFFNETLKYNLWILMSCQMMPKRWFSIIINTTLPPSVASASASTAASVAGASSTTTTTVLGGWLTVWPSVCPSWMQN